MLDAVFTEIAQRNWAINSLYYHPSGSWFATLRSTSANFIGLHGRGNSPAEALQVAMNVLESGLAKHRQGPARIDLSILLKRPPINRRGL